MNSTRVLQMMDDDGKAMDRWDEYKQQRNKQNLRSNLLRIRLLLLLLDKVELALLEFCFLWGKHVSVRTVKFRTRLLTSASRFFWLCLTFSYSFRCLLLIIILFMSFSASSTLFEGFETCFSLALLTFASKVP